jgi:predicted transcriptional regulator
MKRTATIGNAELRVLKYIAENHPISARDVATFFLRSTGEARTTVITVMERLRRKGYLTRKKEDGCWRYSPKLGTADVLKSLVGEFVERTLHDSLSPFMAYLVHDATLSDQELAELKRTVQLLEARKRSPRNDDQP